MTHTTSTRMGGPTLTLFRIGWIATALLIGGLLLFSIPYQYAQVARTKMFAPEVVSQIGLTTPIVSAYDVLLDLITMAVCFTLAILLFVRRSNERIALLTSLMLITWGPTTLTGMLYSLDAVNPAIEFPLDLIKAMGEALLIYFGFTFPTGKYNPKWTAWFSRVYGVWVITSVLLPDLPISRKSLPDVVSTILELAVYIGAVGLQVYRFRRVLTPDQVQQAKWVVYGMVAAILGFIAVALPNVFIRSLNEASITGFWYEIFLQTFLLFSLTAIPIGMGLSILRYRLWDVDFLINRSLVYVALTLFLGAIFVGLFMLLQASAQLVTGGSQSVIALSAAGTAVGFLFNPTRLRVQRWVDQRVYGINVDYRKQGTQTHSPLDQSLTGETFGTRIGTYEVLDSIGFGGMSEVYLAKQPSLNRQVAIKMLNPGMVFDDEARSRFEREARTLAALKHPNILEIYDFGEHEDLFYMVIEYIPGDDLKAVIDKSGAIPIHDACTLITGIARALDYAHSQGVVHRDVKPANVLLKRATGSGGWSPILSDFGIARLKQQGQQMTKGMLGTVDYMSPEQIRNLPDIDGRADVYALGVMAFEMLTGKLPYDLMNAGAILMAHMSTPIPDPRVLRPDLSERHVAAITRAMAKDREHRYATAEEFAKALCA